MNVIKQQSCRLWKIVLAVCLFIYPIVMNTMNVEAYTSFQYLGKISDSQGRYGSATVGNFVVDGRQAFCLEHPKSTPSTGTVFAE